MKGAVKEIKVDIDINADQLTGKLHAMVADIQAAIGAADFTPDDYHPPAYPRASGNSTLEKEEQAAETQVGAAKKRCVSTLLL